MNLGKLFFVILGALTLATVSFAGVAEKKALKKVDAMLADDEWRLKEKCGNPIKVTHNCQTAEKLKADGKSAEDKIEICGSRCHDRASIFTSLCENDADYKAEIAKISEINCSVSNSGNAPAFKLNGKKIVIEHDLLKSYQTDEYEAAKKAF